MGTQTSLKSLVEMGKEPEKTPKDYSEWQIFIDIPQNKSGDLFKLNYLVKLIESFQIYEIEFYIREHYTFRTTKGEKIKSSISIPCLSLYHKYKKHSLLSYNKKMNFDSVLNWINQILSVV